MNDRPDIDHRKTARRLGWASLALGAPLIAAPRRIATVIGVDDDPRSSGALRAVGIRELGQGLVILASPGKAVWTRVLGDLVDLRLLARAAGERTDGRRSRVVAAGLGVTALSLLDVAAAARAGRRRQHGRGRPGPLELQATVTVNTDPEDAYGYWRNFERLPSFMRHLESVTVDGDGVSTWQAKAPIRRSVRWRAEMTGDEPGRRISWKSLPGSDIANAGTVHFARTPDGKATEVKVALHYDVPGGAIGRTVAKLFGEEPEQQVRDDLRRFKQILETGDVVRSDALPEGADAAHQLAQRPARPAGKQPANRRGRRASR